MSAENIETAKGAYSAFGQGDMDGLSQMFAEDAQWLTSDELPLGGLATGRDEIIGNFAQIPSYWSEFSVEPEEFIDGGDWVVVRGTQRASGENGSFEAPFAHLIKIEDGKLVRGEFYSDSAKAKQALGG
jgi:ketosteroid isomerase-like protein